MDYRLYVLDSDGHIRTAKEFNVDNDDLARERAEAEAQIHPVELWRESTRIGSFGKAPALWQATET